MNKIKGGINSLNRPGKRVLIKGAATGNFNLCGKCGLYLCRIAYKKAESIGAVLQQAESQSSAYITSGSGYQNPFLVV